MYHTEKKSISNITYFSHNNLKKREINQIRTIPFSSLYILDFKILLKLHIKHVSYNVINYTKSKNQ